MRGGLGDGEHLVERVEVVQRPASAASTQPGRGLAGGLGAAEMAASVSSSRAPWCAISSSTRAWALPVIGPWAGSNRASGRSASGQRAQERAERIVDTTGSKPIDGVIVGSTWSPANSRRPPVVEHDVAAGVTRRRHDLQAPARAR